MRMDWAGIGEGTGGTMWGYGGIGRGEQLKTKMDVQKGKGKGRTSSSVQYSRFSNQTTLQYSLKIRL